MTNPEERRAAYEANRQEAERLRAAMSSTLQRLSIAPEPRPGFAGRRRDRMLRVPSTRTREG